MDALHYVECGQGSASDSGTTAAFVDSLSPIVGGMLISIRHMATYSGLALVSVVSLVLTAGFSMPLRRQAETPSYARIAILRPDDGATANFEAGYARHLGWHRQAKDPWSWYGWTIWAGERQRWFVYATFGHSAADFDAPVAPADDERDSVLNVAPHARFVENRIYQFLPHVSHGTGVPPPLPRLELVTVELTPGSARAFEAGLQRDQEFQGDTLWYRLVAGGQVPGYVRLRPRPSLAAILEETRDGLLPDALVPLVARTTTEILNLRPTLSYGLTCP
jgi:hypothetical protein